jgi:glycosyltransferase involved in cell wall biosynthesis
MDAQQSRNAAVIIPARDDAARIALTVLAARALPGVDLVVVVDDASSDSTARVAQESGATVVRHTERRGRAAALDSGAAAVDACDGVDGSEDGPPAARALLLLAADLGPSAAATAPLLRPVLGGETDMAVGISPGRGLRTAPERCLTRDALEAALPLAPSRRPEELITEMVGRRGFRVVSVPVEVVHREPVPGRWRRLMTGRHAFRTN